MESGGENQGDAGYCWIANGIVVERSTMGTSRTACTISKVAVVLRNVLQQSALSVVHSFKGKNTQFQVEDKYNKGNRRKSLLPRDAMIQMKPYY